jgi:hypothetical protein
MVIAMLSAIVVFPSFGAALVIRTVFGRSPLRAPA